MRIPSRSLSPNGWCGASFVLRYWFVLLAVAFLFTFGSPTDAMAQTYRGKVVDAETGQPLEGAVFVIVWNKKTAISMNGSRSFHSAKEALTDAKGEFSVNGSPGIDWNPFTYVLGDPRIVIYMPDYGPFPVGHLKAMPLVEMIKAIDETIKAMTGAGAIIKLPKLKTQQELRQYTFPGHLHISATVPYEEMPNLIRLINIHNKLAAVPPLETPAR